MGREIRAAIIGAGRISIAHAEGYMSSTDAKLIAVSDIVREKAKTLATRYGAEWTTDYLEILKRPDIDVVSICTPNELHAQMAIDAAEAGKHIICEKPMAMSLTEADAVIAAVRKNGTKFTVDFTLRYSLPLVYVKNICDEGVIGKIRTVRTHWRGPLPISPIVSDWYIDPRRSGGLLFDRLCHDADLVRWFTGKEVKSIYAQGSATRFVEYRERYGESFVDSATISLDLDDNILCNTDISYIGSDQPQFMRVEILGSTGSLISDPMKHDLIAIFSETGKNGAEWVPEWTCPRGWSSITPQGRPVSPKPFHIELIKEFVNCVKEDKGPPISVEDGRASLEITIGARESIEQGVRIRLPL